MTVFEEDRQRAIENYRYLTVRFPEKCPRCGKTDFKNCQEWVCYLDPNMPIGLTPTAPTDSGKTHV